MKNKNKSKLDKKIKQMDEKYGIKKKSAQKYIDTGYIIDTAKRKGVGHKPRMTE